MALPQTQFFDMDAHVMHHIQNAHEWTLPFVGTIHLPSYLSLHSVMILLACAFLIVLFCFLYRKDQRVPHGLTGLLEVFVLFIRDDIVAKCMQRGDVKKMTPFFCTMFFFLLTLNLMGLIPLFSTATANVNVTGAMALITLSFMVFGGIYKNGILKFAKSFVPPDVPFPILIILIPIEILSVMIKAFALMVRLFANMVGGHIAILSLMGAIAMFGVKFAPIFLLVIFMYLIELMVAFLQAFIFTFFSAMFIGQMYHPEH